MVTSRFGLEAEERILQALDGVAHRRFTREHSHSASAPE
jgi:hypothetical protein